MKWSILICTLPQRREYLDRMMGMLNKQLVEGVEVLVDDRSKIITTGKKRNDLMNRARGEYICSIDDDDFIIDNYIELITNAMQTNPDVITFEGWMTTDGKFTADWVIKLGEKYEARNGVYYRFPNHLAVMKRHLAMQAKFPNKHQGEDYEWALKLKELGVFKTSVHIPHKIYHYAYLSKK